LTQLLKVVSEPTILITLMKTRSIGMADEAQVWKELKELRNRMTQFQSGMTQMHMEMRSDMMKQMHYDQKEQ
jgi:hypothetical protein